MKDSDTCEIADKLLVIKKFFNRTVGKNEFALWYEHAAQGDLESFRRKIEMQYAMIVEANYEEAKIKSIRWSRP